MHCALATAFPPPQVNVQVVPGDGPQHPPHESPSAGAVEGHPPKHPGATQLHVPP
jgi:hypothetical protein